jgi:hypothetical protein
MSRCERDHSEAVGARKKLPISGLNARGAGSSAPLPAMIRFHRRRGARSLPQTKLNYVRYFVAMLTVLLCGPPILTMTGTAVPERTPEGTSTLI